MIHAKLFSYLVAATALCGASAHADFIYLTDDRRISGVCGGTSSEVRPNPPFADFNESGGESGVLSSQESSLRPTQMDATGTSLLTSEGCPGSSGGSEFRIRFMVTEDAQYVLSGDASFALLETSALPGEDADVLYQAGNFFGGDPVSVASSGVFKDGAIYWLVVWARVSEMFASGVDTGSFSTTLRIIPVPEPSFVTMVGAGVALLALRKHA